MPTKPWNLRFALASRAGCPSWLAGRVLALAFLLAAAAMAQHTWTAQGPGPTTGGQVEGIPDGEVVGAVHDVAPHPTDANILFVGAVNGGIWRTTNAIATSPTWTQLTGGNESLSIGALEFDPTDPANQTLVAGLGRFSSSGRRGGLRAGLLLTTDSGATWTADDGGGTLDGLNISGVAPRGGTIVLSANTADTLANRGIWRRATTGGAWTQISGAAGSGLPSGAAFDLVGDPSDDAILYTNAGGNGIYRSTDTGATWTKVSDAAVDGVLGGTLANVEIAVTPTGSVFVGIVTGVTERLAAVFRSPNGSAPWTQLDTPQTTDGGSQFGIHPGGQGDIHFSIAADPDGNIVYVGGDRQVGGDEGAVPTARWPNSVGAQNYTGRLFRIDSSLGAGNQASTLTHVGTAGNSSPHADSRDMAFDANDDLLEADDGGVYRRTSPQDATGDWSSVNGDLQTAELYGIAWDAVADIVASGAQDTGVPEGLLPADPRWREVHQGDGGDVAVNDTGTPGRSFRFTSSQRLFNFQREEFDATNTSQGVDSLLPLPAGITAQFITPLEIHNTTPLRMIVAAQNDIWESIDGGSTLVALGAGVRVNRNPRHPLAYGASDDANVLYAGSFANVWVRTGAGALTQSATYPGTGTVADIAVDPASSQDAWVVDVTNVYRTQDAGASWTDVTGDLMTHNPGDVWSIVFMDEDASGLGGGLNEDSIAVGTDRGVYVAEGPMFNDWEPLGMDLPNVQVVRLDYDEADQILLAGTLGRGAWILEMTVGSGGSTGDPHMETVDGTRYDFQTAGEFVALRGGGVEIQARQTAIATSHVIGPNAHTGLTTCVSLNSAVAAQVGPHRVSYQPDVSGVPDPAGLQLRVDGNVTALGPSGLELPSGGRVQKAPAGDGIQIDFPNGTRLVAIAGWWSSQSKWYLNINVYNTTARQGVLGALAPGSWLPRLPDGISLGPRPAALSDRYDVLHNFFANAWRVTDSTSLFDYAPGMSTADFTIPSWPHQIAPCVVPPTPPAPTPPALVAPLDLATAQTACAQIRDAGRRDNCVFDVQVTGELGFAETYLVTQQVEELGTTTLIAADRASTQAGEDVTLVATVLLTAGDNTSQPTGTVQFVLDGNDAGGPIPLDASGHAAWTTSELAVGEHEIAARYEPAAGSGFLPSASQTVDHEVTEPPPPDWRLWLFVVLILVFIFVIWWWLRRSQPATP